MSLVVTRHTQMCPTHMKQFRDCAPIGRPMAYPTHYASRVPVYKPPPVYKPLLYKSNT